MNFCTVGPGDEETWGPCYGHRMDPRTVEHEDERCPECNGPAEVTDRDKFSVDFKCTECGHAYSYEWFEVEDDEHEEGR